LSIEPSFFGFMPSSWAICTCACESRWRLRACAPYDTAH
jgi:hypothetical protein